ncbi:NADH dehydrogenase subunit 4 [Aphis craccivora]|uniref:NADH dehydrogenase subunit 4 (Mitochondrion) n=1 Tax=Aphis craccivora TaxID=307492 RepID=A0A6G0ZAR8_APHCR|nr:NADH dehydrogenase subunit 4 [Aphis craccivora]
MKLLTVLFRSVFLVLDHQLFPKTDLYKHHLSSHCVHEMVYPQSLKIVLHLLNVELLSYLLIFVLLSDFGHLVSFKFDSSCFPIFISSCCVSLISLTNIYTIRIVEHATWKTKCQIKLWTVPTTYTELVLTQSKIYNNSINTIYQYNTEHKPSIPDDTLILIDELNLKLKIIETSKYKKQPYVRILSIDNNPNLIHCDIVTFWRHRPYSVSHRYISRFKILSIIYEIVVVVVRSTGGAVAYSAPPVVPPMFIVEGYFGSLILIFGHGLCSSGLFCLRNICYLRFKSRSLFLNKVLPICYFILMPNSNTPAVLTHQCNY